MGKQISTCDEAARRAWRVLRLALLWARKGGLLKCRLVVAELRHMPSKYLKSGHHHHHRVSRDMVRYGERELSFDDTPVIHLRMSRAGGSSLRFMLPCIKPNVVDFDYDFGGEDDDNRGDYEDVARTSFLKDNVGGCRRGDDNDGAHEEEEENVDVKAEEFIAKFYAQMKMQRQVSLQQRQQHTI